MSGFKLDFDDIVEGFAKVEDGYYEVIIDFANEDATKSGAEFANIQMTVRNDLDQPFKNQKIWHRNFRTKATGEYGDFALRIFNTIGKAIKLQTGKKYDSYQDLLDDFAKKPVLIFVKNETSEYDGKTYENLEVKSWKETKFPDVQHQFTGGNKTNDSNKKSNDIDISDDDLPFS